jgi:hypothetical protein
MALLTDIFWAHFARDTGYCPAGYLIKHTVQTWWCPSPFSLHCQQYLETAYTAWQIRRQEQISWTSRSPDMNPFHFFLWGQVKNLGYPSVVDTAEQLLQHVQNGFTSVHNTLGIFQCPSFHALLSWGLCGSARLTCLAFPVTLRTTVTSCHPKVKLCF